MLHPNPPYTSVGQQVHYNRLLGERTRLLHRPLSMGITSEIQPPVHLFSLLGPGGPLVPRRGTPAQAWLSILPTTASWPRPMAITWQCSPPRGLTG